MDNLYLSPADYASLMLENTDENGILRIPEGHFTDGLTDYDETAERVFVMDWDAEKLQAVTEEFEALYEEIRKIAELCLSSGHDPLHDARIPALESGEQADVWKQYLRGYEYEGIPSEAVAAIEKSARAEMDGEDLTEEEKQLCDRYFDAYTEAEEKESAKRLGGGLYDVEVILRARRVCRLMTLHAPDVILRNEAQRLAEVLILTRYAKQEIDG